MRGSATGTVTSAEELVDAVGTSEDELLACISGETSFCPCSGSCGGGKAIEGASSGSEGAA